MGVIPSGGRFDFNSTTYLLGILLFHTWCTLNFYSKEIGNLVNLYVYLSDIQQDKLWHISYFHQEFQVLNIYLGNFVHICTHQSKKKKKTLSQYSWLNFFKVSFKYSIWISQISKFPFQSSPKALWPAIQ